MDSSKSNFEISIKDLKEASELRGKGLSLNVSTIVSWFYEEFEFPTLTVKDRREKIDEEIKKFSDYLSEINVAYLKVSLAPGKNFSDNEDDKSHRSDSLTKISKMKEDVRLSINHLIQISESKRVLTQLTIGYISLGISILAIIAAILLAIFL